MAESQAGGDAKAIRGRLARLAVGVLKRLGQQPNPGPIIGEFNQLYAAEAVDLAKNQILAQSATAMLAQASAISQNILGLLR